MKRIIILVTLVLFITACGYNKRYKVQGKLNNSSNELILLKEMTSVDYIPIDSTRIDKNGEFKLTGKNSKPAFYMLYISKNNYITLIVTPGEKVIINGDSQGDSFVAALSKTDGHIIWKVSHDRPAHSFSTPIFRKMAGKMQMIFSAWPTVSCSLRLQPKPCSARSPGCACRRYWPPCPRQWTPIFPPPSCRPWP